MIVQVVFFVGPTTGRLPSAKAANAIALIPVDRENRSVSGNRNCNEARWDAFNPGSIDAFNDVIVAEPAFHRSVRVVCCGIDG